MTETASPDDSNDRSRSTIWARFQSTREWLAVLFIFWMLFCLVPGVAVLFAWVNSEISFTSVLIGRVSGMILLLVGIQSALGFGLCQGLFGIRGKALLVTGLAGLLCCTDFLLFASTFRNVTHPNQVLHAGTGIVLILLGFPGMSIFFLAYLLWRTNTTA